MKSIFWIEVLGRLRALGSVGNPAGPSSLCRHGWVHHHAGAGVPIWPVPQHGWLLPLPLQGWLWAHKWWEELHRWVSQWCVCVLATQSCLTLCGPIDGSPLVSSVHGILQARILEWEAIPFSRGSFSWSGLNPGLLYCRRILYCLSQRPEELNTACSPEMAIGHVAICQI